MDERFSGFRSASAVIGTRVRRGETVSVSFMSSGGQWGPVLAEESSENEYRPNNNNSGDHVNQRLVHQILSLATQTHT